MVVAAMTQLLVRLDGSGSPLSPCGTCPFKERRLAPRVLRPQPPMAQIVQLNSPQSRKKLLASMGWAASLMGCHGAVWMVRGADGHWTEEFQPAFGTSVTSNALSSAFNAASFSRT